MRKAQLRKFVMYKTKIYDKTVLYSTQKALAECNSPVHVYCVEKYLEYIHFFLNKKLKSSMIYYEAAANHTVYNFNQNISGQNNNNHAITFGLVEALIPLRKYTP